MRVFLLNALLFISLSLFGAGVSAQSLTKERVFLKNTKHKFLKATNTRMVSDITLSLPILETKYFYDSETETWDVLGYTTNEYDKAGNLVMKASFDEIGSDTITKTIYQYDEKGTEIGYLYYTKNYSTNSLDLSFGYKTEFTYDLSGRLSFEIYSIFDEEISDFYYEQKLIYKYNGNQQDPSSFSVFQWDGFEWIELGTYENVIWYDFSNFEVKAFTGENSINEDGNIYREFFTSTSRGNSIFLTEIQVENEWVPVLKNISIVDEDGNAVSIDEKYVNTVWVNSTKDINLVDEMGNYAGYEFFNWVEDAWELEHSLRFENIYDINGILVEQIGTSKFQNSTTFIKTVFSEFETFIISSTASTIAGFKLNIFPNPVNDALNIVVPNMESAKVQLFNIQNILVQTGYINAGNGTLHIGKLTPGVYILKIETASGLQKTERIVKR
jgi:hypothetical protein